MDLSTKTKRWLNKYFLPIQSLVTKIRFNHLQLQTLFPKTALIDTQYPSLQSITWNYIFGYDDHLSLSYLNKFKSKLSSLTLNLISTDKETVDNKVALVLLQNDSCLKQLICKDAGDLSCMWFSFRPNTFKVNQHLKQLTIKLHYAHDLFLLVENLSTLEYLDVEVCEIEKKDLYDYTNILTKTSTVSPLLKTLIIHSLDLSYPRVLLFLQMFQQTIEFLTLEMGIYDNINGEILESTIVQKMPNLKEFQFFFHLSVDENININKGLDKLISTFHSTSYWTHHPVMCYHDRSIPCFHICSLPWILGPQDSISNEIINHRTNITTKPLQIPNIKSIFLAGTGITLKLIKFINDTFINLNKMIISWHTCTIDNEVIYGKNRIQLPTVKTLKYFGTTEDLENFDFFVLTPNLRRFVADGISIHIINAYVNENKQLMPICDQISHLHIFRNYSDCDEDETKDTFPNALIISKDI